MHDRRIRRYAHAFPPGGEGGDLPGNLNIGYGFVVMPMLTRVFSGLS